MPSSNIPRLQSPSLPREYDSLLISFNIPALRNSEKVPLLSPSIPKEHQSLFLTLKLRPDILQSLCFRKRKRRRSLTPPSPSNSPSNSPIPDIPSNGSPRKKRNIARNGNGPGNQGIGIMQAPELDRQQSIIREPSPDRSAATFKSTFEQHLKQSRVLKQESDDLMQKKPRLAICIFMESVLLQLSACDSHDSLRHLQGKAPRFEYWSELVGPLEHIILQCRVHRLRDLSGLAEMALAKTCEKITHAQIANLKDEKDASGPLMDLLSRVSEGATNNWKACNRTFTLLRLTKEYPITWERMLKMTKYGDEERPEISLPNSSSSIAQTARFIRSVLIEWAKEHEKDFRSTQ